MVSLVLFTGHLSYLLDLPAIKFKVSHSYHHAFLPSTISLSPHFLNFPSEHSQILCKEVKQSLIPSLILALHSLILQIRPSSHPSVNLVIENLNVFLTRQISLEFLDVFCGLVSGCEHAERDLDVSCFGGIDHCGVAFCCCFEGSRVRGGGDGDDFTAPAELSLVSLVVEE